MAPELREDRSGARTSAILIWAAMSLGPVCFFLSLLSIGVWLLGLGQGWWPASDDPPSDFVLFGPIVAVILAELIGGVIASATRSLAGTAFESHRTSAIRTFWVMLTGFVGSNCLAVLLLLSPNINAIGFSLGAMAIMAVAVPVLFIWKTFRVVRGLRLAWQDEPIADPTRWP